MKLQQLTAAPPDLWAVFAEMENGPDNELRPASGVESVQRVVCLALADDQRDTDEAVDIVRRHGSPEISGKYSLKARLRLSEL